MKISNLYLLIFIIFSFYSLNLQAGTYHIDGEFDGCDYEQAYPIQGGGVLVCNEYNYFYEYSPEVISDGRKVILIGGNKVDAKLQNGSVIQTRVDGDFEGCDFDKKINLQNGLIFVCSDYGYSYAYNPKVTIVFLDKNLPVVYIKGKKYNGRLYKP